uniref:GH10 domain-containing protein n=1 Tax=Aegilops tauschii TaxID=37682 RepID=M8BMV4_AEGTA
MEPVQGQVSYTAADANELFDFCDRHKPVCGRCIFCAMENSVQPWIRALNNEQLKASVVSLRGEQQDAPWRGAFFRQRLGDTIDEHLFQETAAPALFMNDYNVEHDNAPKATQAKYTVLVTGAQKRDVAVGRTGVLGHVTYLVGDVIRDTLDKLAAMELQLPVWIMELDASAADEAEGHMWRSHGHLVNADGALSEAAGNRFVVRGMVDANGHFKLRGLDGKYLVELAARAGGKARRAFGMYKGGAPTKL